MNFTHTKSASGRWFELSLAEQMGNIGSEVSRYEIWKNKGDPEEAERCFFRALELIDLTILDDRWKKKNRLKEIGRVREVLCDTVSGGELYNTPISYFQDYFMDFALVARKEQLEKRRNK